MEKGQIRYTEKSLAGGELFTIRAAGRTQSSSMQRVRHGEGDGFRVEYMLEGTGYVRREADGRILQVTGGQMLFVRQGCEATIWADREKPVDRVWFLAEGDLLSTLFSLYRIPDVYAASSPALPECIALLDLLETGETDGTVCAQAAALLSSILVRTMASVLFPADRSGESTARQMQAYIDSHLYEDLRLDGMAVRFGYAKMHLIRLFREEIGTTPIQYVLQKRMEAACRMLTGTVMSVGEIAELLQYSSAQHFAAAFRKYTGISPTDYRRNPAGERKDLFPGAESDIMKDDENINPD